MEPTPIEQHRNQRVSSNLQNNQAIFDQVMAMLMLDLYPEPHERPVDININTLCNRMHRNNRNNNSA